MKVGMNIVKLQERRSINFSQSDIFSEYCSRMIKFCPYLEPAEKNNVLFSSNYYLDGQGLEDFQESLFYVGVLEIERFRKNRSKYNLNKRLLYCENVIINLPSKFKHIDGSELFAWPHYLLKLLYTQVGIMLGKFWVNEKLISKKGISIPVHLVIFYQFDRQLKVEIQVFSKKRRTFL